MLKNASLLAIVAVHTAENEPFKVCPASQPLTPPGPNEQRWVRDGRGGVAASADELLEVRALLELGAQKVAGIAEP